MNDMEAKTKKFILALSLISGTTIGVGFFGLPYIASQIGIWSILLYFLFLGGFVIFCHFLFAEVSLKTPDFKRFPQFAKIHLGKKGESVAYLTTITGLLGALLAYLIVGARFIEATFPKLESLTSLFIFFLPGAILIFKGVKSISRIEFWGLVIFILVITVLFLASFSLFEISNLKIGSPNRENFFLPYGPILFSLWGAALIPEAEEILSQDKKLLLKVVPLAILIPALIYLFFIFWILGISGSQTTEAALDGLKNFLPNPLVNLALFLGIVSTFTSFIALGLTLKNVFWYDLKINKNLSFFLTVFVPLFFYFFGLRDFILVISILGAIFLAIDGILIVLMYKKVYPEKFRILKTLLILVFALGIVYEIIYLR